jgi:hypothetical protein
MIHHRDELIRERTQRKNKLTAICDELFPELTRIYENPNSAAALALRTAFPTPATLATASLSALQATRRGAYPSTAKLVEVQQLATQTIGTHRMTLRVSVGWPLSRTNSSSNSRSWSTISPPWRAK